MGRWNAPEALEFNRQADQTIPDSWSQSPQRPEIDRQKRLDNAQQLEPESPLKPEIDSQKDQAIPDSWSQSVP